MKDENKIIKEFITKIKRKEKVEKCKIYRMEYKNKFIIEIDTTENDKFEFWIFNKNYGIKMLMFGINIYENHINEIIEILERNINNYVNIYKEKYMD